METTTATGSAKSKGFAMKMPLLMLSCLLALSGVAAAQTNIVVSMAKFDDKFLTILRNSVESAAKTSSDLSLKVSDAKEDSSAQIEQVRQAVADKADAIIMVAVDGKSGEAAAKMTAEAGIPLVFLNRRPSIDSFGGKVAIVSSNDLVAGRLQARVLSDKLSGKGKVAILIGDPAQSAAQDRTKGVKEVLAKISGMEIVKEETAHWDRKEAEQLVSSWIAGGVKLDAIAANNDEMALGAIAAIKKAGLSGKVLVAGVDGTADAVAAIESGDQFLSVLQNAKAQGAQAVADAKSLAGGNYAQQYDWVPYELIIKDNAEQYAAK